MLELATVNPVRIVIADDHEVVRRSVRAVLENEPGWTVCGEAATGRQAIAEAIEQQPDVVILDVAMPDMNGLDAARHIRHAARAEVLIVTVDESIEVAEEAIEAGAAEALVEAVRRIVARRPFPRRETAGAVDDRAAARSRPSRSLTSREQEVLRLLAAGRTNKEIASTLDISVKTVETHRARILSKLDIHSMNALVRYALRNNLTEL